ncbi:MBL fold metallo-hydrolase [Solimonas sp. C16B3]|uniref:MBL fold metallo-hydrolase n=2 Tax=Solimonas marina TaxID=2714601 RepID=A0A969WBC9_9GAMM|nr:MBL fold metallo-hydrolase [Solimonas marina]
MTPSPMRDLGFGIRCIDTLQVRPQMAACYLIERGNDLAFVEAGTSLGVPHLMALLEQLGLARDRVRYVIPTHVHLDHAGGAGALMRELPNAKLVVHPRGARHMVDPTQLIAGATAVYGAEAMARMYGEILPVDESRVIAPADGESLPFGDAALQFIDTPGHARHHFSVWDAQSRGFFTGDTFGLSYREFDSPAGAFVMPTTTPVQFEPDAWRQTLDRYLSFAPQRMFLTHYSVVEDVTRLANDLRAGLARYELIATELAHSQDRHERLLRALTEDVLTAVHAHGSALGDAEIRAVLDADLELNAQGLGVWLDRRAR